MTTPNSGLPGNDVSGCYAPSNIIPRLTLLHHSVGRDQLASEADFLQAFCLPSETHSHHVNKRLFSAAIQTALGGRLGHGAALIVPNVNGSFWDDSAWVGMMVP